MIKKETVAEVIRFCVVGVLVTVLHYGVYWLLLLWMHTNIAFTIGYVVSFILNYYLTARYTFQEKASAKNGFAFGGAHLFNYILQMGLLNFFLWLGWSSEIAPVGVYVVSVPVNFLLVRLVFKYFKCHDE